MSRYLKWGTCIFATVFLMSCARVQVWQLPSAFDKGMVCPKWDADSLRSRDFGKVLKQLKKNSGIQYVQIDVVEYQDTVNSVNISIMPNNKTSENYERLLKRAQKDSDTKLKAAIKQAHRIKLKVLLVPKIRIIDGRDGMYGRGDIGFTSEEKWNRWFGEYEEFILHYAEMAKKYHVDIFCVGDGLSFTQERSDKWNDIIKKVRKVYKGKLLYAADKDTYSMVDQWDKIDYVGINMDYSLFSGKEPGLEDIKNGLWRWSDSIEGWDPDIRKPIVFKELGSDSVIGK